MGTSLVAQWIKPQVPNAGGSGFDPWSGNQIPYTCCN